MKFFKNYDFELHYQGKM